MTKPTIKIHDVETNKIIEREMTDKEVLELNPQFTPSVMDEA